MISTRSHVSLSWFSWGSSILVELEFGDVGFCEGKWPLQGVQLVGAQCEKQRAN